MSLTFYEHLEIKLYESKSKQLLDFNFKYKKPFKNESINIGEYKLPKSFLELYKKVNGFEVSWRAKNIEQAYGHIEFIEMEEILSGWEGLVYHKEDLAINELLQYFHPFDQVSPEILCGIIIKPNEFYESVYLQITGETNTNFLDLNFDGYITMLLESKAYKNWPMVLLHLSNKEYESDLISDFKRDMPQLFSDFNWDNFTAKYESLRLSNKVM